MFNLPMVCNRKLTEQVLELQEMHGAYRWPIRGLDPFDTRIKDKGSLVTYLWRTFQQYNNRWTIRHLKRQLCMKLVILSGMKNLANYDIASELVINEIQYVIKYIVKPPYHSHAIILPVQIKTACFLLCTHSYIIAFIN